MYRRVGGFWPSNRHRSLDSLGGSDATTRRRPEMRASTNGKHKIRKRFALVIGVAAVGVMALGAQTGAQTPAPTPPGQAPVTCNVAPATMVGTAGSDQITGTPATDVIVGFGGNDTLSGQGGNDVICGGDGNDLLKGGKGNDNLSARRATTRSRGKSGNDLCQGGPGKDTASGSRDKASLPPERDARSESRSELAAPSKPPGCGSRRGVWERPRRHVFGSRRPLLWTRSGALHMAPRRSIRPNPTKRPSRTQGYGPPA